MTSTLLGRLAQVDRAQRPRLPVAGSNPVAPTVHIERFAASLELVRPTRRGNKRELQAGNYGFTVTGIKPVPSFSKRIP